MNCVETIRPYVDEFIQFAKENKNLTFLVTRIGCGIAGFTDNEISAVQEGSRRGEYRAATRLVIS